MFNGNRTERQPLNDRRPKRAESVGKALPAGYTAGMVRMLYLRDIDVDVHVRCCACGHSGVLPRAMLERRFGPNYPVLSIAPHYRCSVCDSRDTESRPAPPETIEPMPAPAMEEAPSFDGPLAALRGLLDAARGGRPDGDEDEYEDENEDTARGDKEGGDKDGGDGTDEGSLLVPAFQPRFGRPMEPPPTPPPVLSLDELAMDTGGEAEGRTPLWEPISLADIASRLDRSAGRADPDQEEPEDEADAWRPARRMPAPSDLWDGGSENGPEDGLETDVEDDREDRLNDRRDDDRARGFAGNRPDDRAGGRPDSRAGDSDLDETLVAMRQFFARDDAEADTAEPAPVFPDDPDEEEDAVPPAFTSRMLARTDFEDDTADEETEEETEEEDPWDTSDEDDDPSNEEILAFAIRDPERKDRREPPAEPAPKRPPPRPVEEMPIRSVRGSDGRDFEDHDASMEKTLAALRSMIEEAAAEPELPTGPDRPPPPASSQRNSPATGNDDEEEDEGADWRWDGDDRDRKGVVGPGQDGKGRNRDDTAFSVRMPPRDVEPPEEEPPARRSSQEMEIEQAMRSLRDLMDADEPPAPPPLPSRPRRPTFGGDDRSSGGNGRDDDDFGFAEPPLTPPTRQTMHPRPDPPAPAAAEPPPRRREGKSGEPSALDKTIAALRGMLELDGKRKK